MIKPRQEHWRILRFINWATVRNQAGVSLSHLAERMQVDRFECNIHLVEMSSPDFSEWGPWVEKIGDECWAILGVRRDNHSTGGQLALDVAKKNVHLEDKTRKWTDNVRAGITSGGRETEIENAVVPAFVRAKKPIDPESAANRSNERFVERAHEEPQYDENGVKLCPACPDSCKKPVHLKSRFCREHKKRRNYHYYRSAKTKNMTNIIQNGEKS